MPFTDRPDFKRWLEDADAAYREMTEGLREPTPEQQRHCTACGDDIEGVGWSCDECLPCLAERFGREQMERAAYVGRVLTVAMLSRADVQLDTIRSVVEDVLDEYECIVSDWTG